MDFKVHPLFFVLALALVLFGYAPVLLWTFAALLLHEGGHIAAARTRGYAVKEMVLLPYGAMMSSRESFDRTSGIIIGISGPAVNAVFALAVLGLWWLFPSAYPYTESFFYANVSLAAFNLLPVYPLDGSRVALSLCKNRIRALKGMQIAGVAVSIIFFILFLTSVIYGINFSFGIIAVFLFYGAACGTDRELYVSVLDAAAKNYTLGVCEKRIKIDANVPILRLYHHIGSESETRFEIVGGERGAVIDEAELKKLALANKLSTPVGVALKILPKRDDNSAHKKPKTQRTEYRADSDAENGKSRGRRQIVRAIEKTGNELKKKRGLFSEFKQRKLRIKSKNNGQ